MLQFDAELCCIASNVVRKVRRYIHLFVASELVSDAEGYISESTHTASTIQTRRIPRLIKDLLKGAQATCERPGPIAFSLSQGCA